MKPASRKNLYHYNRTLRPYAKKLRGKMTKAERHLWHEVLKKSQLKGYVFRSQRPILHFIADFMSKRLRLVIEVDGSIHLLEEVAQRDLIKTKALEGIGFTVLRFTNEQVLTDIEGVRFFLEQWVDDYQRRTGITPRPRQRNLNRSSKKKTSPKESPGAENNRPQPPLTG